MKRRRIIVQNKRIKAVIFSKARQKTGIFGQCDKLLLFEAKNQPFTLLGDKVCDIILYNEAFIPFLVFLHKMRVLVLYKNNTPNCRYKELCKKLLLQSVQIVNKTYKLLTKTVVLC